MNENRKNELMEKAFRQRGRKSQPAGCRVCSERALAGTLIQFLVTWGFIAAAYESANSSAK